MGFRERKFYHKSELVYQFELPDRSDELVFRMRRDFRGYEYASLGNFEEVKEIRRRQLEMLNSGIPFHNSPFFPEGLYREFHDRYPIGKPVSADMWEAQCGVWLECHGDVDEARRIIEERFLLDFSEEKEAERGYTFRVRSDGAVLAVRGGAPEVIDRIPERIMGRYQLIKEIPGL